jgi:hypothetical protein
MLKEREFFEFTERLRAIPLTETDYYINVVLQHLKTLTVQSERNLNSYVSVIEENHRWRLINALKYIDFFEMIENKKIIFSIYNTFNEFKFKIDYKPGWSKNKLNSKLK